jgi:ABC-type oligopeptide transport system substrate-binding subunit
VTAHDFAVSLERALGPEGSSGTAPFYLGLIEQRNAAVAGGTRTRRGITVVNPTTLRITLSRPAAHFLTELAFPVASVPDPTLLTRYGQAWTDHAAGFGPYYVQAWHHSRSLTLERNPFYYGGLPPLASITIRFYSGDRSGLRAYDRGDVDVVTGWQAGDTTSTNVGGVQRVPALALDYLAFNAARVPFRHLNARRALAAAVTAHLVRGAMNDTAFPVHSFLPSAFGISIPLWQPRRTPGAYLSRAGYPGGKHFPPVALVMPHDPHLYALGTALQRAWKRTLGITITPRSLNSKDYGAVLDAHAFDLALVRWGGDYPDPQDFLGTQIGSSPDNVTQWTGPRYSDDVTIADSYHPNDPRRVELFRHAARIAEKHLPLLPLDEPAVTAVIRPGLTGVSITGLGTLHGDWAHARFQS